MKNTLGGGIIAILVGAVIYYEAMELEQGVVLDVSGRRAIVKLLFAKVALFLGTTGAAILFVAIVAIVLYLLYKKYKLENIQTVYQ